MPSYEMTLIMKVLPRPSLSEALKRSITIMMEHGAVITKVDNLGYKRLPFVIRKQDSKYYEGHYFVLSYESPPEAMKNANKLMSKDQEIIRHCYSRQNDNWVAPCSLPDAKECEFGEIKNPNHEKLVRRMHGFRWY